MFLIKFFYFLKGYVIIEAYGSSVFRFVSECALNGIRIYNISGGDRLRFSVFLNDFYDVYTIAKKFGITVGIKKEFSIENFVFKHNKRLGFVAGICLFVTFFAVSTQFLWDVRVETNGNIDEEEVKSALQDIGIKPGVRLSGIPDGMTVKNHLINSFHNVPWAWMYVDGIRANVIIHEGIVPPSIIDEDAPCDIIASRDGFITDVSVKKGIKTVLPGNAVNAGEVLVSGLVEVGKDDNKKYYQVHADGEVMAYTRYEKSGEYSLFEDRPEFTGRSKTVYNIKFKSKKIQIFSSPEYEYSIKTKKSIVSAGLLSVEKVSYKEARKTSVQLPVEWVIEFAKRDLTAQISEQLGRGARLQSEDFTVEQKSRRITVKAQMEFIENIGVAVPR